MHDDCSKCELKPKIKKGFGYYAYTVFMIIVSVYCALVGLGIVDPYV